jgi:hypothetical protein
MVELDKPLVSRIAAHWESSYPDLAARLKQAGRLEMKVESAALRASRKLEQALAEGLSYEQAKRLATEDWRQPPQLTN